MAQSQSLGLQAKDWGKLSHSQIFDEFVRHQPVTWTSSRIGINICQKVSKDIELIFIVLRKLTINWSQKFIDLISI
ncbi:hypothetical protein C1Y35_19710 [Pseudomonas sp. GW456-L14]|nr:hypothetical protein C1Y35_19710 [Pseudomonas sp. GW456-L14]PMY59368.1 hypothetical protein C1Y34_02260 [Pseudomonas sp. GW456-L12]